MSPFSCSFCSHVNPAGSKFCNECGSPLGFKPCPECEAVNSRDARTCHQCGADLTPRPVPTQDSFEERLDTLRRYVDSLEGTPAAQRLGFLSIAAHEESTASSDATPAMSEAPAEPVPGRAEPVLSTSVISDAREPLRAPIQDVPPEPPGATREMSVAAEPVRAAPEISTTPLSPFVATPAALAFVGTPSTTLPESALGSPPNVVPEARRRSSPGFFYATGLVLLVVGILGYAYSLYGLPAQVERWIGSVRALAWMPESSTATVSVPAAPAHDSSTMSTAAPAAVKTLETSGPVPAPGAENAPTAPSPAIDGQAAVAGAEPNAAPAPPGPMTAAESSAASGQGPTAAAVQPTESQAAKTPPAPEAAAAKPSPTRTASKKHASRSSSKRTDPRKAPSNRSMIDPEELTPLGVSETRVTASPDAQGCARGVAALGLCNANERQEAN